MRFSKRKLHFLFFVFYVGEIETEKRKRKRPKNPIKIGFFKGGHPKMLKIKTWFFLAKGRKTPIFVHTICFGQNFFFGPKQCKAGNTIKIGVSAEIAKKQK